MSLTVTTNEVLQIRKFVDLIMEGAEALSKEIDLWYSFIAKGLAQVQPKEHVEPTSASVFKNATGRH